MLSLWQQPLQSSPCQLQNTTPIAVGNLHTVDRKAKHFPPDDLPRWAEKEGIVEMSISDGSAKRSQKFYFEWNCQPREIWALWPVIRRLYRVLAPRQRAKNRHSTVSDGMLSEKVHNIRYCKSFDFDCWPQDMNQETSLDSSIQESRWQKMQKILSKLCLWLRTNRRKQKEMTGHFGSGFKRCGCLDVTSTPLLCRRILNLQSRILQPGATT